MEAEAVAAELRTLADEADEVVWTADRVTAESGYGQRVKLARLEVDERGLRQVNRYVDRDTRLEIVPWTGESKPFANPQQEVIDLGGSTSWPDLARSG